MGADCEDICVSFECILRVPAVEETVNTQVDKMAHSDLPSHLGALCGLVDRVAVAAGMVAVHVLSDLDFPMVEGHLADTAAKCLTCQEQRNNTESLIWSWSPG